MDWTIFIFYLKSLFYSVPSHLNLFIMYFLAIAWCMQAAINSNNRCFDEMTLGHSKRNHQTGKMKRSRAGKKNYKSEQAEVE